MLNKEMGTKMVEFYHVAPTVETVYKNMQSAENIQEECELARILLVSEIGEDFGKCQETHTK